MKTFQALGWTVRRQAEHIVMTHPDRVGAIVSIPNHKEVRKQTLKSILKGAGYDDKTYRTIFDLN